MTGLSRPRNRKDENHDRARTIINEVVNGKFGVAYTSDYVFDEAVTVALARTRRSDAAIAVGKMILGELTKPFTIIMKVDNDVFEKSWKTFTDYSRQGLSFTDCTSLTLMRSRNIERIASFDAMFEGSAQRVH
ncbi:MAG: type II toxin-antitoxin system VapC family toxin [Thaumarchaeota archaeon]|nr:type II toxin-antitoxin system VapC family toxin [Nitrososphaerota archaeon]